MGTEQNRFLLHQDLAPLQRRKRWGQCLGGLPCFRVQKNVKRVVPSSRVPEANSNSQNRAQNSALANQAMNTAPSLLAPPSSPISFTNSAIPSTVQSPNCFPSATSPERPSMFVPGPYANEPQLVSPPVFSTYTTEPSTAPYTPPPELAHLTTPSSPDVPYAHISSSTNFRGKEKNHFINGNDFRASYSPYKNQDSNFFCPETFAQFYLDNLPNSVGRLSVSKESDVYPNSYQNTQNSKTCNGDEIEAYRASFGFSADDIDSTQHYVEINDVMDESLTIWATTNEESSFIPGKGSACNEGLKSGHKSWKQLGNISAQSTPNNKNMSEKDNMFSWRGSSISSRKYQQGLTSSDAEIDYRRGRSLREHKTNIEWVD